MVIYITLNCVMPEDNQEVEVYDRILEKWRLARYTKDKTSTFHVGWFKIYDLSMDIPSHSGRFISWRELILDKKSD